MEGKKYGKTKGELVALFEANIYRKVGKYIVCNNVVKAAIKSIAGELVVCTGVDAKEECRHG